MSSIPQPVTDWMGYVSSIDVKIWVENPEVLKEPGILLKASDGELVGVRHRYSEFETLRGVLKTRYAAYGILVPSLPDKKILSKQDKEFLTERMQGLTLFCESIVANPWLRHDKAWKDFMSSSTSSASSLESDRNISEEMLINMLDKLLLPADAFERVAILKDEVTAVEKQLIAVIDATRNMQLAYASASASMDQFKNTVAAWSVVEENMQMLKGVTTEMMNGNTCSLAPAEKITALTSRLVALNTAQHVAIADLSDFHGVLVSCSLEHELARCVALKELLKHHDELASSIDSLRVKVEKLEANANTKWDVLQESKRALETKKVMLTNLYKGLFYFTLPFSVKHRSENIRRALGAFAATAFATAVSTHRSSLDFLRDLDYSVQAVIADTCHTLDLLNLPTLQQPPESSLPAPLSPPPSESWILPLYESALRQSGINAGTTVAPAAISMTVQDTSFTSSPPEYSGSPVKSDQQAANQAVVRPLSEIDNRPVVRPVNSSLLNDLVGGGDADKGSSSKNGLWS